MDGDSSLILGTLFTLLLVFLNGFFVAAEFAIVKVRASQLQSGDTPNSVKTKAAMNVINNLDGYLAATQLGITLASLGLGWVGEEVFTHIIKSFFQVIQIDQLYPNLANQLAVPVAFSSITFLHIVFGELAPKSLAIRHPKPTTLAVAAPLRLFYIFGKPFIVALNYVANLILKLIGIKPVNENEIHSEEELKLIVAESAEGGAIEQNERELIQNVFDFDDLLIRQIYINNTKVVGMPSTMRIKEASKMALEENYSRYPVYEGSLDNVIGMLHSKDLLRLALENSNESIKKIMRPVVYVHDNKKVNDLLRQFQKKKTQFAVVTNEFGASVGIVTMENIIEELVGDIQDEHDHETPVVEKIGENLYRVQSQTMIDELNEHLPFSFPLNEDYDTLSGYIAQNTEDIPAVNQVIQIGDFEFKILKMFRTSPEIVEVKLLNSKDTE